MARRTQEQVRKGARRARAKNAAGRPSASILVNGASASNARDRRYVSMTIADMPQEPAQGVSGVGHLPPQAPQEPEPVQGVRWIADMRERPPKEYLQGVHGLEHLHPQAREEHLQGKHMRE